MDWCCCHLHGLRIDGISRPPDLTETQRRCCHVVYLALTSTVTAFQGPSRGCLPERSGPKCDISCTQSKPLDQGLPSFTTAKGSKSRRRGKNKIQLCEPTKEHLHRAASRSRRSASPASITSDTQNPHSPMNLTMVATTVPLLGYLDTFMSIADSDTRKRITIFFKSVSSSVPPFRSGRADHGPRAAG